MKERNAMKKAFQMILLLSALLVFPCFWMSLMGLAIGELKPTGPIIAFLFIAIVIMNKADEMTKKVL